jgi:DNA-binding transcriptional MerR regulator
LDKAPDAFRTISEVSQDLDVPQHVLRFWETRFAQIRPMKRGGGRRYYRPDDVDLLRGIRHLLYGEGYTIRGVQRILREQGIKFVQTVWHAGIAEPQASQSDEDAGGDDFAPLPPSPDEVLAERGRKLFSLLPSLLTQEEGNLAERLVGGSERREPELSSLPRLDAPSGRGGIATAVPHKTSLGRDDVRKLQATLHELGECRRLLEAVLHEPI